MKAVRMDRFGGRDAVTITDIETPRPGGDQVLVEMHSSSINPADIKVREGLMVKSPPIEFPMTLGMDIAGVVDETGPGVTGFRVGDRVYGQTHAWSGGTGAYAEYALTSAGSLAVMPVNIGFPEAGVVPLVGVSAIQALYDNMKLTRGQRICILGGAGGIGGIAIQLAKHIGAHVATTGTGNDTEYERSLGADEIIDYRTQAFDEILSGFDAVFDMVGGETLTRAFGVLKRGGIIVSMVQKPDEALMERYGVVARMQFTKVTAANLARLTMLIEDGVITIHVERTYPLDRIVEAFEAKERGPVLGKIGIAIR